MLCYDSVILLYVICLLFYDMFPLTCVMILLCSAVLEIVW